MVTITAAEAAAFNERWELVREREEGELRSTTEEAKFQRLCALMASRCVFGTESGREAEVQLVRERWSRLRQAMAGRL